MPEDVKDDNWRWQQFKRDEDRRVSDTAKSRNALEEGFARLSLSRPTDTRTQDWAAVKKARDQAQETRKKISQKLSEVQEAIYSASPDDFLMPPAAKKHPETLAVWELPLSLQRPPRLREPTGLSRFRLRTIGYETETASKPVQTSPHDEAVELSARTAKLSEMKKGWVDRVYAISPEARDADKLYEALRAEVEAKAATPGSSIREISKNLATLVSLCKSYRYDLSALDYKMAFAGRLRVD